MQPDQWRFAHTPTQQNCRSGVKCEVIVQDECILVPLPKPHQVCRKWVNVDETHLARGNPGIHVVWHLEDRFYFCATDGDGVFLKSGNDGQFDSMYSTEKMNGDAPADADCKKHRRFHWNAKNTVPRSEGYMYVIKFHKQGDPRQIVIDPWIYNN